MLDPWSTAVLVQDSAHDAEHLVPYWKMQWPGASRIGGCGAPCRRCGARWSSKRVCKQPDDRQPGAASISARTLALTWVFGLSQTTTTGPPSSWSRSSAGRRSRPPKTTARGGSTGDAAIGTARTLHPAGSTRHEPAGSIQRARIGPMPWSAKDWLLPILGAAGLEPTADYVVSAFERP